VLYVTDANGLFAGAVEMVRFMQLSAHLPPLLVVGVGYRKGAIDETILLRARDFTPTFDPGFQRIFPDHTLMGGADRFLAFFRDELQPWVRSRYRVDAHDAAYFGHSLGGLFGTYVLLTQPDTFTRYGIGSPSLWWHDDMIFGCEAGYAATHDDLPAKAFFAVGANEDHDGRQREASRLPDEERSKASLRYIDMAADTERMVASLRSRDYPNLEIDSIVLPDEFHVTVQHVNLSRALRFLFDAPR
jgi:predicted alpha/beta superfamily hydrolase